jgi:membrane protease subunit HflK
VLSDNRTIVGGDGRNVIYVPMGERRAPTPAPNSPLLAPDLLAPPTTTESTDSARPTRAPRSSGRDEVTR